MAVTSSCNAVYVAAALLLILSPVRGAISVGEPEKDGAIPDKLDKSLAVTLDIPTKPVWEALSDYKKLAQYVFGQEMLTVDVEVADSGKATVNIHFENNEEITWEAVAGVEHTTKYIIATITTASEGAYEGLDLIGTVFVFTLKGISLYNERVILEGGFVLGSGVRDTEDEAIAKELLIADLIQWMNNLQAHFGTYPCPADFRTYDGHCNNVDNPWWGTARSPMLRNDDRDYDKRFQVEEGGIPSDDTRPSARKVSNVLMHQTSDHLPNSAGLNMLFVTFGQFVDHDLTLNLVHSEKSPERKEFNIEVEMDDEYFNKFASKESNCKTDSDPSLQCMYNHIKFVRTRKFRHHGEPEKPYNQFNLHTSYLDLSQVYGVDMPRAQHLRAYKEGRLLESKGRLLPFESADGSDPPKEDKIFAAGDPRANEQPYLTLFHILFMREHNRIAEDLAYMYGDWDDEKLYQEARRINIAGYQHIIYNEWLPFLVGYGALKEYEGYDSCVDASAASFFSTVAFRFGHTLVSGTIQAANSALQIGPTFDIADTFFKPQIWHEDGVSVNGMFCGAMALEAQEMDAKVHNQLRNLLFSKVKDGKEQGFDLASANVQRGRDHSIPSWTAARKNFGLPVPSTWYTRGSGCRRRNRRYCGADDLLENREDVWKVSKLYGHDNLHNLDAFPLGLLEKKVRGALVGPLFFSSIVDQFTRLRDGDRFFYKTAHFSCKAKDYQHLSDIMDGKVNMKRIFIRNIDGYKDEEKVAKLNRLLPENVFMVPQHNTECEPPHPILKATKRWRWTLCPKGVKKLQRYFFVNNSVEKLIICDVPDALIPTDRKGFETEDDAFNKCLVRTY